MKGLSLPINLIVILAIAVMILVIVSAWFVGVFTTQQLTAADEDAFRSGCQRLRLDYSCAVSPTEIKIRGYRPYANSLAEGDTLLTACIRKFPEVGRDENACKVKCDCMLISPRPPATTTTV